MKAMRRIRSPYRFLAALPLSAILLLAACGGVSPASEGSAADALRGGNANGVSRTLAPVSFDSNGVRMPEASGENVKTGGGATLDASNTGEGYVMVASEPNEKAIVTRVTADDTYTYRQPTDNTFATYPLQMGDGAYSVQVFEQVTGDRYARVFTEDLSVTLADETVPFLYPNQYVPYTRQDSAVAASFSLADGLTGSAAIADRLYRYVRDTVAYDYDKAATVQEGYLPVPDETLSTEKGICFDYAALLATMLRAQGIPAKLVIGHVAPDNIYHAWNEAYVDGRWIFFDPTLAYERRDITNYSPERVY